MTGICSYKDLENYYYWDQKFGRRERDWFVIILGRLDHISEMPALKLILDNYTYLNERTRNVRYFMPGFMVGEKGIISYLRASWKSIWVTNSHNMFDFYNRKFDFDLKGFAETINWLEDSSDYTYSEETELILLPYHLDPDNKQTVYDFDQMQSYNLDKLYNENRNVLQFIEKAVKVVRKNLTVEETKRLMVGVNEEVSKNKVYKVFIAGSKDLVHERDGVRSVFGQLSNKGKVFFQAKTFEDFPRSLTKDGRQSDYNEYIRKEADFVIFILDGRIGGITKDEFDIAWESFKHFNRPKIYVYYNITNENLFHGDVEEIKNIINSINQYYNDYRDIKDLKAQVEHDFVFLE